MVVVAATALLGLPDVVTFFSRDPRVHLAPATRAPSSNPVNLATTTTEKGCDHSPCDVETTARAEGGRRGEEDAPRASRAVVCWSEERVLRGGWVS